MNKTWLSLVAAALLAAPFAYAHDGADGVPGTPDTTCETGSEWNDHDYGPPAAGLFIQGHQESNLEDCDGDFNPTNPFCWAEEVAREDLDGDTNVCERFDDDGHNEYTRGGAWLLVNTGDGVTGGTLLCFGRDGHHPNFGPVSVTDLALGQTVPFTVEADLVDATGLADPCGDFQSDVSTSCVGTCSVTYPAGLDGSYQVYVGFGSPGTQGHVTTGPTPPIPCGPDTFFITAADPQGGNNYHGQVTLHFVVGVGAVLTGESVVQTGGPAPNPNPIVEGTHTGTGSGSYHQWTIGGSIDFETRTFTYTFTTRCDLDGGSVRTTTGTVNVYN